MKNGEYMQQGDVIIEKVDNIPSNSKTVKTEILVHGEVGHAHKIASVDLSNVDVFVAEDGTLYCQSIREFTVVHEEHKPITLPGGKYKVRRVLEYDHFLEETKRVMD